MINRDRPYRNYHSHCPFGWQSNSFSAKLCFRRRAKNHNPRLPKPYQVGTEWQFSLSQKLSECYLWKLRHSDHW